MTMAGRVSLNGGRAGAGEGGAGLRKVYSLSHIDLEYSWRASLRLDSAAKRSLDLRYSLLIKRGPNVKGSPHPL